MANNRLTWQQVDAPDLSAEVEALTKSGGNFRDAMGDIGKLFSEAAGRQRALANNEALSRMMQFRDIEGWDKALESQGLRALGIDPRMASPELMATALGYRDDLAQDREKDQFAAQRDHNLTEDRYTFDRTKLGHQKDDATEARKLEALRMVDELLAGGTVSKEHAALQLRDMKLEPQLEQEAFAALEGAGEYNWGVAPGTTLDGPLSQNLSFARETLAGQERALNFERQNNRAAMLYAQGAVLDGQYESPLAGMVERLRARAGTEETERFSESEGDLANIFQRIKEKNPAVPDEIVAAVMENHLQGDGLLGFFDKRLKFNTSAIEDELKKFATEDGLASLEDVTTRFAREGQRIANTMAEFDRIEQELVRLKGQNLPNDHPEIVAREQRLRDLMGNLQPVLSGTGEAEMGIETDAEEAAAAEAAAGIAAAGTAPDGYRVSDGSDVAERVLRFGAEAEKAAAEAGVPGTAWADARSLNPEDAPQPDVDPRITNSRSAVGGFLRGAGQWIDGAVGDAAAFSGRAYSAGRHGAGIVTGLFHEEKGSELVRDADRIWQATDRLAREGFVPTAEQRAAREAEAAAAAAENPVEASPSTGFLLQQAQQAPAETLEAIVTEAGIPAQEAQEALAAMNALRSSQNLTPEQRREAQNQIRKVLRKAMQSGAGSAELQALMAQAPAWLPELTR